MNPLYICNRMYVPVCWVQIIHDAVFAKLLLPTSSGQHQLAGTSRTLSSWYKTITLNFAQADVNAGAYGTLQFHITVYAMTLLDAHMPL